MIVYAWRNDSRKPGDAQQVGEQLASLRRKSREGLHPEAVVVAARKDKVLRPYFTWDDTDAADRWRVHQARGLIGAIVVVQEVLGNIEPVTVRAFYAVDAPTSPGRDSGQVYVPLAEAMTTHRDAVLGRALAEAEAWRRRYRDLAALAPVFDAIDAVAV